MLRLKIRSLALCVTVVGAASLLSAAPMEASTSAMSCRTFCLDECPFDQQEFCAEQGCETQIYNCAPFGICDAAMYCGS